MISLFTTFFLTEDTERQNELITVLRENISNTEIKSIYIFLDGSHEEATRNLVKANVDTTKVKFLNIKRIPTYGDWVEYSKLLRDEIEDISVYVNADIYTDSTIKHIKEYLDTPDSIVCLSRHEVKPEGIIPHPNPHWSQDLWAISKQNMVNITNQCFLDELSITRTGMYRCDNKLAFLFTMRGWCIFNPQKEIKCFHLQNKTERSYGRFDLNIIGGLCFVGTTDTPAIPSELDVSIMPSKVGNITKCAINKFLHKNLWQ